jgi:hypothetical protein
MTPWFRYATLCSVDASRCRPRTIRVRIRSGDTRGALLWMWLATRPENVARRSPWAITTGTHDLINRIESDEKSDGAEAAAERVAARRDVGPRSAPSAHCTVDRPAHFPAFTCCSQTISAKPTHRDVASMRRCRSPGSAGRRTARKPRGPPVARGPTHPPGGTTVERGQDQAPVNPFATLRRRSSETHTSTKRQRARPSHAPHPLAVRFSCDPPRSNKPRPMEWICGILFKIMTLRAIRQGFADVGARHTRPFEEFDREFRSKHGLPPRS